MMQGLAGWMSAHRRARTARRRSRGLSLVDLSGGYVAAIALLAGLWRARRDGVGCDCDVSLFETALARAMYVGTWVATAGLRAAERCRTRRTRRSSRSRTSSTADGWIVVACREGEVLGAALRRDRAAGPGARIRASPTIASRDEHRDVLLPILADDLPPDDRRRVARPARPRGRAEREDQLGARSARGPADAGARGRRRARPPRLWAACARSRRRFASSPAGRTCASTRRARAVPGRAHRVGAGRVSAATRPSASVSCTRTVSSEPSRSACAG